MVNHETTTLHSLFSCNNLIFNLYKTLTYLLPMYVLPALLQCKDNSERIPKSTKNFTTELATLADNKNINLILFFLINEGNGWEAYMLGPVVFFFSFLMRLFWNLHISWPSWCEVLHHLLWWLNFSLVFGDSRFSIVNAFLRRHAAWTVFHFWQTFVNGCRPSVFQQLWISKSRFSMIVDLKKSFLNCWGARRIIKFGNSQPSIKHKIIFLLLHLYPGVFLNLFYFCK